MPGDWKQAKRFTDHVRKTFPDARPDSAEEGGKVWRHKECIYDPDRDVRVRAVPDFSACIMRDDRLD